MTKSRGIGRGRYDRSKAKRGKHYGRPPKHGRPEDGPTYYLNKYKTTQRPRKCSRCYQNAYYYHEDFGNLCAPHLLDLVNIGGLAFDWEDYPEVWERTERLLQREPKEFGTAWSMDVDMNDAVMQPESLDGFYED